MSDVQALALVLFTGSRHLHDRDAVEAGLMDTWHDATQLGYDGIELMHGACPDGADAIADQWATAHGIPIRRMPADWDHCGPNCPPRPHRRPRRPRDRLHPGILPDYCPGAGPRRNAAMVALHPEYCLAAPVGTGRSGTRNCMRLAAAARIPVHTLALGVPP
ncbi:SLOG family protein [Streptomyces scabiei]|uniref:SLOG family protein n=1 Tax=Streptomyces scabiei TaxID=1930 RepID=UPI001B3324FC|nr:SLOG family protein [Streptomyces sp. LBUM 1481]